MDENIQNYRQPMVTAIGIILGFVLGFTGKWATDPATETHYTDYLILLGLLTSTVLFIVALYRILNNNFPADKVGQYYKKTLQYFIVALFFAFSGILISIFQTLLNH
jgi:hypothetical protein